MQEYYEKVIEATKTDLDTMLADPNARPPKALLSYLDALEKCTEKLEALKAESKSEWDRLSKDAQDKINKIIQDDLKDNT